ncbi:MAG: Holliday junction branch migration protein RuvA [Gammaproteobacteria bacterium]|nr:Holliday junction branch migration protein RuvA [Gammaproteobacteria bacterium]
MIGFLRGVIADKQPPQLLLDVNGVGYEVNAPMCTFYRLPKLGETVVLYTHLSVREDAHTLFGFYDNKERELFRTLIKINGVGPKMALAILSGMEVNAFVLCVQHGDTATLTKLPGVGKKTAERLVIEMCDKFKDWDATVSDSSSNALISADQIELSPNEYIQEAEDALVALGYKAAEASRMVSKVKDQGEGSETLIRLALKGMVG